MFLLFLFTAFRAVSWLGITLREVQEDKWQGAHREGARCTAQGARDRCAEVQCARCEGARCEGARCKVDQRCKVQGARCEGARGRCKGQVHRGDGSNEETIWYSAKKNTIAAFGYHLFMDIKI